MNNAIDRINDLVQPGVDHVFGKVEVGVGAHRGIALWKQRLRHSDHIPDIRVQRWFAMALKVDGADPNPCAAKVSENLLENLWRQHQMPGPRAGNSRLAIFY